MSKPFCVICSKSAQPLTSLSEITFQKCKSILEIRKRNNLSLKNVVLPTALNNNHMYHRGCYQRFTALPPKHRQSLDGPTVPTTTLEPICQPSTSTTPSSSECSNVEADQEFGVDNEQEENQSQFDESKEGSSVSNVDYPDVENVATASDTTICIMCELQRKRIKGRNQPLHVCHKHTIEVLKSYAIEDENYDLIRRINESESQKIVISYHNCCKKELYNRIQSKRNEKQEKTEWHRKRNIHKSAFELVLDYILENVIDLGQCYLLSFLKDLYINHIKSRLVEFDGTIELRDFEERLLASFPRKIAIVTLNKKKIVKPFRGVLLESNLQNIQKYDILNRAAIILRSEIQNIKRKPLPIKLTATNMIAGECDVPEIVRDFYSKLISTSSRRRKSENKQRLATSFSEDLIYAVSNGVIKTSKHISLGMSLKSLTNSKKIINIINRFGHCCSYTVLEELETDSTLSSISQSRICPEGIKLLPNLKTGLAFNNFDRFVDTTSGKDTLHDTVGKIFQDIVDNPPESESDSTVQSHSSLVHSSSSQESVAAGEPPHKRPRSSDFVTSEIRPFSGNPKYHEKLLNSDSPLRLSNENIIKPLKNINFTWVLSHLLKLLDTPAWVGFNSLIHEDTVCKQRVSYLTIINSSPTNNGVVAETMERALQAAGECQMDYIEVSYDLAITKVALQIQSLKKPKYDRLFIHVGSFHVMMAYFKAVGKFIDGSGLTNIMVNSEILASGSVNSFLTGKHFNRCKRLHPMLSLALQILHFESFLKTSQIEINDDIKTYLLNFKNFKSPNPTITNINLLEILDKYDDYRQETLRGLHGKTAQYYMMFMEYIDYYFILNYSIRLGNFEMFKYILPYIGNIFFTFNQQNYARYIVLYHEKLLRVQDTHPGLELQLNEGSFGVKRTDKPFSRQPIDLTLEQTINADAANKLTGISHLTNSISARQRWCKSHSIRSSIISYVMDRAGLRKYQDITADLEKNRIKKHSTQLQDLIRHVEQNINPFSEDLDKESLYNISTGQAVDETIEKYLLDAQNLGNKQRETFIKESSEDEKRYEKAIKRNKVSSFVDAVVKKKISVNGKLVEARMQRDLFGKLLRLSLENSLNIESVLSYPLTPIPLSLCHIEGAICKTDKSVLFKILEKENDNELNSDTCDSCDVMIYDGFFIFHQLKDLPVTFANISKKLLQIITTNDAHTVILVFDRYFIPSIKDNERLLRGVMHGNKFSISGPEQKRPSNFSNELKNIYFKEALIKFIIDDWAQNHMAPFFSRKTIYINYDSCFKFEVIDDTVLKTVDENLSCPSHEEADTKIIFHVCKIDYVARITIRCSDTDILVIMLGNMPSLQSTLKIRILAGTGNNRRYVDVNELFEKLGRELCSALPAFHALTGCDCNPSFYRKGKIKPLKILRQSPEYMQAMINVSKLSPQNLEDSFTVLEEFVCRIYGQKRINDIDQVRVATFMKAYKNKSKEEILKIDQNFEGSMLPPCKSELRQHFLRTSYISQLWNQAHLSTPTSSLPTDFGWTEEDGKYVFKWFEGEQCPRLDSIMDNTEGIIDILETRNEVDNERETVSSEEEDDSDADLESDSDESS